MAESGQKTKVWLGLSLVVLLAPVGFVAGGVVAAFTVTEMGLAAIGVYFGYMTVGALLAMVAGLLLAVGLSRPRLMLAVEIAGIALLLAAGVVAARAGWVPLQEAAGPPEAAAPMETTEPKPVP